MKLLTKEKDIRTIRNQFETCDAILKDRLENLMSEVSDYDADVAVLYDNGSDLTALSKFVNDTAKENLRVVALKAKPERLKVRKIYKITGKEVSILEDNA